MFDLLPHFDGWSKQHGHQVGQSGDVRHECGVASQAGAAVSVERNVSSHHQPLVLVLWLIVDHDGVDRGLVYPGRADCTHVGHGIETDLVGILRTFQRHGLGDEGEIRKNKEK